jgi:cell division protein FtsL
VFYTVVFSGADRQMQERWQSRQMGQKRQKRQKAAILKKSFHTLDKVENTLYNVITI